jgi:hypothetical protein
VIQEPQIDKWQQNQTLSCAPLLSKFVSEGVARYDELQEAGH